MKHWRSMLILCGTVALVACTSEGPKTPEDPARTTDGPDAEEMYHLIEAMEDSIFDKPEFDKRGVQALYDVYIAYVRKYPTDTVSPDLLFRAAGASKALGRPQRSIELYDQIIDDHPAWSRSVDAYYLRAFTFDNDLKRMGPAKKAYEEVIEKFPDHKFAADAKIMIENLGLSDEELIKKFQERAIEQGS